MSGKSVPLLLRVVWFVLVGFKLGVVLVSVAYILCVTVVGLPLGIWLLHRVPLVMTLKLDGVRHEATGEEIVIGGRAYRIMREPEPGSVPVLIRVLWFGLAGWWLTGIWLGLAYLACALIITLPVGFWMYNRVPAILTLEGV